MIRIIVLLAIASCTTIGGFSTYPSHPDPRFKASMQFTVSGSSYEGVALLPRRQVTDISFQIPKTTHVLFINSCAREDVFFGPFEVPYRYSFTPGNYKENVGSCPLLVTAITSTGESHRAVLDFTNSTGVDMTGEIFCNGTWRPVRGASICQVRSGLSVSALFTMPVILAHVEACAAPKCVGGCQIINGVSVGLEFDIPTQPGLCLYDFNNEKNEFFRLTTLGYTSILNIYPPLNK
jgi:hypothetical protein